MIFSQRLTDTAYFPGFRLRSTEEGDTWVWGELEPHGLSCSSGAGTACTTETSLPENSHLHAPRELKCPKITHSLWRRAFPPILTSSPRVSDGARLRVVPSWPEERRAPCAEISKEQGRNQSTV